jgi:hypothetical protein
MFSPYHTISNGGDPEPNSVGDDSSTAAVASVYKSRILTIGTNSPATKNFLFGLNITF